MSDQIRVNYEALLEMAQHCEKVAERIAQTQGVAMKIAGEMQSGALVGDVGETFAGALSGNFVSSTGKLFAKFIEVSHDIRNAVSDMKAADTKAGSNF